jgi:hypothetical protein
LYALGDVTDSNYDTAPEFIVPAARQKAAQLRSTRQYLAAMRHELLVSLRVVNTVEKEVVDGEWMNWLGEEMYRCDRAAQILSNATDDDLQHRVDAVAKVRDYCRDCNRVWGNVKERCTELS